LSETALHIFNVHHQGTIILTHEIEGQAEGSTARIVFHRFGDAYFLSEVWLAARATRRKAFRRVRNGSWLQQKPKVSWLSYRSGDSRLGWRTLAAAM
jgi:hypothetical protein